MKSQAPFATLCLLLTALLTVGCGGNKQSQGSAPQGQLKIAFMVKQPEEPWFQLEWRFAGEASKKYGFELITIAATEGDQVLAKIENVASQGAQGLILCTPDVKLGPAIVARAKQRNIKLITVDDQLVGADGRFLDVPHVGISARKIGNSVGDALLSEMKQRGWSPNDTSLMVITYDQLDTARERTEGAIEAAIRGGFPKDKVIRQPMKSTDLPASRDAAGAVLARNPEVKNWLVASMNDSGVMGPLRAMEAFGIPPERVAAIGIGGDQSLQDLKRPTSNGLVGSILLQAKRHGFDTAEMMYRWLAEGKIPPKITYTAGVLITRDNYKQVLESQGLHY